MALKGDQPKRDEASVPGVTGDASQINPLLKGLNQGNVIHATTKTGLNIALRVAKPGDEGRLRDFLKSLSIETVKRRFGGLIDRDYLVDLFVGEVMSPGSEQTTMLALTGDQGQEVVGIGQYFFSGTGDERNYPDIAYFIGDSYQGKGVGTELVSNLIQHARTHGFKGVNAEIDTQNSYAIALINKIIENQGLRSEKRVSHNIEATKIHFY